MSKEYAEAVTKWAEMEKTKYSDKEIRRFIKDAEWGDSIFAVANAETAKSMIMYNEMIDRRIEKARKTWKRG